MTEEEKLVLRTMHDLACRQLGPLLAQSGSEGGGRIGQQLEAMQALVDRLTAPAEIAKANGKEGDRIEPQPTT